MQKRAAVALDTTDPVGEDRLDLADAWLVISTAKGIATVPVPRKTRFLLGRASTCDVVIDDGSVSREHAAIFDIGGELRIEDLASRNHTKVMGHALTCGETAPVVVGSVLSVGHATIVVQRGEPRTSPRREEPTEGVVIADPTMQRLHDLLDVIAPSALNVLLLGETGTGKEVFADALHRRSTRARGPVVRVNCASLAGSLLESELFGHERGAFTGATGAKAGLFEAADGGTLFLDEIGEMPLETQAKVLRVIESGEVTRLGGTVPRMIDVRYVAATHRDLGAAITAGRFRADLYFRLNGYTMTIPALRERKHDIVPLARHFLARLSGPADPHFATTSVIGGDVAAALERQPWTGNIRELKNVIERARVLAGPHRPLRIADLQLEATRAEPAPELPPLRSGRGSFEQQHIRAVLEQTNGDRKAAAAALGVTYRTLLEKLRVHRIASP